MSETISTTPEPSKFAAKLKSFKPSTMDDVKKETIKRRIRFAAAYTAAFASGVLITVAALNAKSILAEANEEVEGTEEILED